MNFDEFRKLAEEPHLDKLSDHRYVRFYFEDYRRLFAVVEAAKIVAHYLDSAPGIYGDGLKLALQDLERSDR